MEQVPELVEQRDDVRVLHQPAREVADEHPFGKLPARYTRYEIELRGVLVLPVAWVQVEIDAAP